MNVFLSLTINVNLLSRCQFCRHARSNLSTYLFCKNDPNRVPYKPAFDTDFILQNREKFEATIKARKSAEIDFDELKSVNDNFVHWSDKENQCLLKIDDYQSKEKSGDSDKREQLSLLLKVYRSKVCHLDKQLHEMLSKIPNLHNPEITPDTGLKVLEENIVENLPVEKVKKAKPHEEISEALGILRQQSLEFVTNTKGFYLVGAGCYLERALVRFTEDFLANQKFIPFSVPLLLSPKVIEGCGQPFSEERNQSFQLSEESNYMNEPLYLAGTSEHSIMGYFMRANIPKKQLPLKVMATSPCFRAELTQGRQSRGIYRVPQFHKVEMVGLAHDAFSSQSLFDEFVHIQKHLFKQVGLPYRVVEIPADDLGLPAYRKIDLEAFMPGRGDWGEISSCSNCTDFQSRRLHVRTASDYLHTVNGTACATPRMIIGILENYQTEDGSVKIPEVLQPYMPEKYREQITKKSNWRLKNIKFSKLSFVKTAQKLKYMGVELKS